MEKKPELSVRVERPPVGSSYSWDQVFGYLKDLAKAVPGVEFFSHITNLAGLSSREMSSDMESFDEVSRLALDTHTPGREERREVELDTCFRSVSPVGGKEYRFTDYARGRGVVTGSDGTPVGFATPSDWVAERMDGTKEILPDSIVGALFGDGGRHLGRRRTVDGPLLASLSYSDVPGMAVMVGRYVSVPGLGRQEDVSEGKVRAENIIRDVPETTVTRREAPVREDSPLEGLLRSGGEPSAEDRIGVYGFAYDSAVGYIENVLKKMSDYVGWKGTARPYNFDGFSGYYPEIKEGSLDICHGDDIVATFYPKEDGSLGFTPYGEEFTSLYGPDVNPWYPLTDIMDGRLCLEPENLAAAKRETHEGREIVYGLRFGEECAYCADSADKALCHALVNRDPNIRLVSLKRFDDALDSWFRNDMKPGFEGAVRPEYVMLAWDGQKLFEEKDLALFQDRDVRQGWMDDWTLIGTLREEGLAIRRELQKAVGIPGDRLFKFNEAVYPNLGIRGDALFISTSYGSMTDFMTVAKGRVGFYCDYDPKKPLPKPVKVFSSCKEALDKVRKVVLGSWNVEMAAKEYQAYLLSQMQSVDRMPGGGEKPSGMKR